MTTINLDDDALKFDGWKTDKGKNMAGKIRLPTLSRVMKIQSDFAVLQAFFHLTNKLTLTYNDAFPSGRMMNVSTAKFRHLQVSTSCGRS